MARNTTWKTTELKVARYFGVERVPLSGMNSRHDTHSDTLHPDLYIEVKRDKSYFGVTFSNLIDDTEAKAKKEKKIPVICLKRHNRKGFYMVIHSDDLVDIAKYVEELT